MRISFDQAYKSMHHQQTGPLVDRRSHEAPTLGVVILGCPLWFGRYAELELSLGDLLWWRHGPRYTAHCDAGGGYSAHRAARRRSRSRIGHLLGAGPPGVREAGRSASHTLAGPSRSG